MFDVTWIEMVLRSITQTLGLYNGTYIDDEDGTVDLEFPTMEEASSWAKNRKVSGFVRLGKEHTRTFDEPVTIQFGLEDYARAAGLPESY